MSEANDQRAVVLEEAKAYRTQLLSDLEAIDRFIKQIEGHEEPLTMPTSGEVSTYRGLGPQAAVEKFLADHPGKKYRASAVAQELLRLGFEQKSNSFPTQVVSALKRAVNKGIAQKRKIGKRPCYWLKEDSGA